MSYAAQLNGDTVTRCIVGTAGWATENLGGVWIDSDHKVGQGWTFTNNQLIPPQPYPSWEWSNNQWNPPIPMPEDGIWTWNEEEQAWIESEFAL